MPEIVCWACLSRCICLQFQLFLELTPLDHTTEVVVTPKASHGHKSQILMRQDCYGVHTTLETTSVTSLARLQPQLELP